MMLRRTGLLVVTAAMLAGQETAESLYSKTEGKPADEAIPLLLESIRLRPTFEAQYRLGVSYNRTKQFAKALDSFREAFRLTTPARASDRAHVFYRRAQAHEGLGELLPAYLDTQQSLALEDHPAVRKFLHALQDALAKTEVDAKGLQAAFDTAKDFEVREAGAKPPTVPLWVNFEVNESRMTPAGRRQAETLAAELASPRNTAFHFLIVGHTDKTGSDAINQPLSERRASEVRRFLVEKNLPADRIDTEGRGSREPLRDGNTESEYRVNRRVEVVLQRR